MRSTTSVIALVGEVPKFEIVVLGISLPTPFLASGL